jgi:hypothetical protein
MDMIHISLLLNDLQLEAFGHLIDQFLEPLI